MRKFVKLKSPNKFKEIKVMNSFIIEKAKVEGGIMFQKNDTVFYEDKIGEFYKDANGNILIKTKAGNKEWSKPQEYDAWAKENPVAIKSIYDGISRNYGIANDAFAGMKTADKANPTALVKTFVSKFQPDMDDKEDIYWDADGKVKTFGIERPDGTVKTSTMKEAKKSKSLF